MEDDGATVCVHASKCLHMQLKPATSVKGSSLIESFFIDSGLLIFVLVAFLWF